MDINETQPIDNDTIWYRCLCGCDIEVDRTVGGKCEECDQVVSAKVLNSDLAATMTLSGSFSDKAKTRIEYESGHDPDELIGKTFGHYEIIQPLGRGGSGFVYQALDTSLQRYVAVKVLKGVVDESADTTANGKCCDVEMLLQEAVAQARVAHPNIVTIYYVGKEKDEPFFAMELVDGISLSERIQEGDIGFDEISNVAEQITRALTFSFGMDIIHGDIKPSNILLSRTGGAKLSDFGLAKRASEKDSLATGGTPNYLAPELLSGASPSKQSDMYALGVTLFEMTFGKLPIQMAGTTVANWQASHQKQEIKFPADWPENLPPQWQGFLTKLLAKKPEDRYESYQQLSADLSKLTPRSNVVASPLLRIIAALIDSLSVILFMLPLRAAFTAGLAESNPFWNFLIAIADFVPIVAYTILVFFWKQSVGRKLMQLRVLNRFGMIPKRRKMAMRSVFRMIVPWLLATVLIFRFMFAQYSWLDNASTILVGGMLIFLLINVGRQLFTSRYKCIHDSIFETQVVIDS